MIIAKANAKENLGEFICLSITKANAKTNLQIFICNYFCVDGIVKRWFAWFLKMLEVIAFKRGLFSKSSIRA